MSRLNRAALVAIMTGGLLAVPAQAQAQEFTPLSSATVGEVDIVVGGQSAQSGPIAGCAVDDQPENATGGVIVSRTTRYGGGDTTCARDDDGAATARASGQRFETSVLRQFGGPTIKVRSFAASCRTLENGSSGSIELSGASGFRVPRDIPPNHTVLIPGANAGDPPMAKLVVNELVVPDPPDGSMTTNTLHIRLFPEGGPASGDIVVGSASCKPFGITAQ